MSWSALFGWCLLGGGALQQGSYVGLDRL
jgi:hypothetical protein